MSTFEVRCTVNYRSLMNKSKSDLADMVLMYARSNESLLNQWVRPVADIMCVKSICTTETLCRPCMARQLLGLTTAPRGEGEGDKK